MSLLIDSVSGLQKNATHNTDNKVNKLVMVFAYVLASKTDFEYSYRDRSSARLKQLCTGINSQPLICIVPRYSNNLVNSCHDWQKPRRTLLATWTISRLKNQDMWPDGFVG